MDIARAKQRVPGPAHRGDNFGDMSRKLNKHLINTGVATQECDEFTAAELQDLQAMLYLARFSDLDDIYQGVTDNRRLTGELDELTKDWSALNDLIDGVRAVNETAADHLHNAQRDGHCHEAVMWWVHHLSMDVRKVLGEAGVVVPLLSYMPHSCEFLTSVHEDVGSKVCKVYEDKVTCSSCHSNVHPLV